MSHYLLFGQAGGFRGMAEFVHLGSIRGSDIELQLHHAHPEHFVAPAESSISRLAIGSHCSYSRILTALKSSNRRK